ncbi:toxin [Bacteroidia bacterium]|nr:toxin [Bacteroidia bacterium]
MTYEWDENKRMANLAKHELDFTDAFAVFEDTHRIDVVDNRRNYGEKRIRTIGKTQNEVIVAVIYTDRNGNFRIISVRRANKKEKNLYYGYC